MAGVVGGGGSLKATRKQTLALRLLSRPFIAFIPSLIATLAAVASHRPPHILPPNSPPHILPCIEPPPALFHPCTIPALLPHHTDCSRTIHAFVVAGRKSLDLRTLPCSDSTRLPRLAQLRIIKERQMHSFVCGCKTRPHDSRLLCITPRPPKSPDEKPCAYENANLRCRRRDEKRKSNRIIRKRTRIKAILGTSRQVAV